MAEGVGQLVGALSALGVFLAVAVGAQDDRGHGEQLRADVDDAGEEALLGLHPALPARHAVEGGAGELARVALDEPQVPGERPELGVGGRVLSLADDQRGEPGGVEAAGAGERLGLGSVVGVRVDDVPRHGQVGVDRLAGDEQVHDLRGPFEDPVDPQVAEDLLGGDAAFAARGQRIGGLEAAPAPDLHQFVGDLVGHLRGPQLGDGGFQPDVVALVVGELRGQVDHGLHGIRRGRDEGDLLGDLLVLADRPPPLDALARPLAGDLGGPLARRDAHRRQGQPPGVERGQRDLQALTLPADPVGRGHAHLVEPGHAVLQALQAHEPVAVLHGDALGVALHDERRDTAAVSLALRDAGHDHEQVGDHAVGGPELDAVEEVGLAALGGGGGGAQPGRVASDVGFGEQERADVAGGAARQEPLLLLLGAEHLDRLRHTDRLVRRQQGADRGGDRSGEGEGAVVVHLAQPEPAVSLGNLHAERAQLLQAAHDLVGDALLALDALGVDGLAVLAQPGEELLAGALRGGVRPRVGVDEVEAESAEVQLLAETRAAPLLFSRSLGDRAGLPFVHTLGADIRIHRGHTGITSSRGSHAQRSVKPSGGAAARCAVEPGTCASVCVVQRAIHVAYVT
ncbi:hypothetical protein NOGI109294_26155 [Nocardiopsis gilva]